MQGTIIVLNGSPRSGKTSIAGEIQASFDGLWLSLGVDLFMQATPERFLPGIGLRPGGERPDLESMLPSLYLALYESGAAHSRHGVNVVVDIGHHDSYSRSLGILPRCAQTLQGLPAWLIGVRCPVEELVRRRSLGNYSVDPEIVARWETAVHSPGIYDMEVDTSQSSAAECARAIRALLDSGLSAHAFKQLS